MTDGLNRRNKLWEGSRMFLPQHKQALQHHRQAQQRVKKPELDEQRLEEFDDMIRKAFLEHRPLSILYHRNGNVRQLTGKLDCCDANNKTLRILDEAGQIHLLNIDEIVEMDHC